VPVPPGAIFTGNCAAGTENTLPCVGAVVITSALLMTSSWSPGLFQR